MIHTFHDVLQFVGLGGAEWIILAAIIIALIFGVKKIPELARSFGRASGEFQKAKIEMRKEVERVKNTDTTKRDKLESIAEKLGIDHANKSDDELRLAIDKTISKKTD
jgi:sec-independent protein translocase protein TatA